MILVRYLQSNNWHNKANTTTILSKSLVLIIFLLLLTPKIHTDRRLPCSVIITPCLSQKDQHQPTVPRRNVPKNQPICLEPTRSSCRGGEEGQNRSEQGSCYLLYLPTYPPTSFFRQVLTGPQGQIRTSQYTTWPNRAPARTFVKQMFWLPPLLLQYLPKPLTHSLAGIAYFFLSPYPCGVIGSSTQNFVKENCWWICECLSSGKRGPVHFVVYLFIQPLESSESGNFSGDWWCSWRKEGWWCFGFHLQKSEFKVPWGVV